MSRWQPDDQDDVPANEELEGEWELDPNDPTHPDYDLSQAAGYAGWEPTPKPWLARRGVILLIVLLVIAGLIVPVLLRLAS